jgi:Mn2+/Fe2+ NRAMP family transporter
MVTRRRPTGIARLGPGLISGAADNDPTTVGTLTSVGATTRYSLAWLTVLLLPMLSVVQMIAAQIGVVTGKRLSALAVERYGRRRTLLLVLSVVIVNLLTIAADIEAGAAALGLLFGADYRLFVIPLGLVLIALLAIPSRESLDRILKGLMFLFVAYGGSAIVAHPHWSSVLRGTFVPSLSLHGPYLQGAIALLGTTLTAYVYLWETIEYAEERPRPPVRRAFGDAICGIAFATAVFWCTLVASGATLGRAHIDPQTAQDAARALAPIAGRLASDLFSVGLLVSALVALPVLVATTALVLGDQLGWDSSLSARVSEARRFYGVIAASLACGCVIALAGIQPIAILVAASIAGGLATPIGLFFMIRIASDGEVMRGRPISRGLRRGGWAVTSVIGTLSVVYVLMQVLS